MTAETPRSFTAGRVTKPLSGFVLKFRGKARLKQTVSALNMARDGYEARGLKSHETSCWGLLAKKTSGPKSRKTPGRIGGHSMTAETPRSFAAGPFGPMLSAVIL
jgi:hypothetical protein